MGQFHSGAYTRLHVRNIRLSADAKQALLDYEWPGNVRELEHLMSRAALLAAAEQGQAQRWITIETTHLGLRTTSNLQSAMPAISIATDSTTLTEAIAQFQKAWLQQRLRENADNLAATARAAGMDRSNFFRLLKKLGLR